MRVWPTLVVKQRGLRPAAARLNRRQAKSVAQHPQRAGRVSGEFVGVPFAYYTASATRGEAWLRLSAAATDVCARLTSAIRGNRRWSIRRKQTIHTNRTYIERDSPEHLRTNVQEKLLSSILNLM